MSAPLRVLLVEDSPTDEKLVLHELSRAGRVVEHRRVEDEGTLRAALAGERWDVVLSDWAMPRFDGLSALRTVRATGMDLPFIIVSGTVGEEQAVAAMRAGAQDYVLKGNLTRLVPAIERECREVAQRAAGRGAEEAVRREQARFRALVESSYDGVAVVSAEAVLLYVSEAAEVMLGRTAAELLGTSLIGALALEDRAHATRNLQRLLQHPDERVVVRRRVTRPDGTCRVLDITLTNRIADAAVAGIVCNMRDLTDRQLAEDALAVAQTRFTRLFESGIIGIMINERSGRVLDANDTMLAMLGYSRQELVAGALDWQKLTPPEWAGGRVATGVQLEREGRVPSREKEYFRKDGSRVPVLTGLVALDATSVIAVCVDLTDVKRAEAALVESERQLRHSQKMEAVGRLAGGVAHDFNNLLSVILTYADMTFDDLHEGDPMRKDIDEIRGAAKRAAGLTRQLLMFSRKQVVEPKVLDLNELLSSTVALVRRLLGEDIELVLELGQDVGRVRADPGGLEQVVMNLAVNARDAMPRGGRLTIRTSREVLDERGARAHVGLQPGPHVVLSVSDTGVGMDAATQSRVFEPFFTTKALGKGTGLGLSTVFGIVQQCGGTVALQSAVGEGTTFCIRLPEVSGVLQSDHPVPLTTSRRGHETILLVEDDDALRQVAREILSRAGYVVLDARNGEDALVAVERRKGPIHLLLSDVVMPRMSGPELASRVASILPDTKVLLMSGYTDDEMVRHGVLDGRIAFLQKPITREALVRRVRDVLDDHARGSQAPQ